MLRGAQGLASVPPSSTNKRQKAIPSSYFSSVSRALWRVIAASRASIEVRDNLASAEARGIGIYREEVLCHLKKIAQWVYNSGAVYFLSPDKRTISAAPFHVTSRYYFRVNISQLFQQQKLLLASTWAIDKHHELLLLHQGTHVQQQANDARPYDSFCLEHLWPETDCCLYISLRHALLLPVPQYISFISPISSITVARKNYAEYVRKVS